MIDIALDPTTHDLQIQNFDLVLINDIDQIAQNLNIRLRFFVGEWFLDTLVGIPYYQYFFIKNPNQIQVDTFLKDEILNTDGVTNLTSYASDYDGSTRQYSVEFTAVTVSGDVAIEVTLP